MKSDKLQNAIGMVDADLVERTEKSKSKHPKFKWTAAVAAMLAIAIGIGAYFGNGSPFAIEAYALAEAEYPPAAPYPDWSQPNAEQQNAWYADLERQRINRGAGKNLGDFFAATISEFLTSEDSENRVYSPLNVYMALAMLAEITDGESRAQILDLLDADSIETLRTQAHAIWNANYSDDGNVTSILASSLWLSENISYKQKTLNTLAENYYASSYRGEMGSRDFNKALQAWMNEQTGGLLKEYISDIALTPNTIMALVTTIYFQAQWDSEFSAEKNTMDVFHAANRDITCEFMHKTHYSGIYYWGEKFSATRQSLGDGFMYFILPDEGTGVQELLTDSEALSFMARNYDSANYKYCEINLSIPKFDVSSKLDLTSGLQNLGITDCFDENAADFTPLDGENPSWLSTVEHGARVAVDEQGVKAAAYTLVLRDGGSAPPEEEIDFVVDRPFLFVITGADNLPLFVGVVNQP